MKLSGEDRLRIEAFAKEAAIRHYKQHNVDAAEEAAWQFALRFWRLPEFVEVGIEIVAIWFVLDEAAAAPFN